MGGPNFIVPSLSIEDSKVRITGSQVDHLRRVRRCRVGQSIPVVDGRGNQYIVEIEEIKARQILAKLISKERKNSDSPRLELFQGLLKGSNMDVVVRAATELGVTAIVPIRTARTVPVPDPRRTSQRVSRWERVAFESAKQARRATLPEVCKPLDWGDALERLCRPSDPPKDHPNTKIIAFWEEEKEKLPEDALVESPDIVALVIGPEGGLTEQEVSELREAGAQTVTLGPNILRGETATVVALSQVGYELRRRGRRGPKDRGRDGEEA